jgi:hypothetical protein
MPLGAPTFSSHAFSSLIGHSAVNGRYCITGRLGSFSCFNGGGHSD